MKKILRPLCFFITILLLTSCVAEESMKLDKRKNKERKQIVEELVEYINKKDVKSLENMFCEYARKQSDIGEKIEEFYDFFDGKIEKKQMTISTGSGEAAKVEGNIELDWDVTELKNIVIDGKIYEIHISVHWIDEDDKELEGISAITLYVDDKKVNEISYIKNPYEEDENG
ncbi:protein of unknown function [Lachnospiraceae bacterium RM5]|nr:protein of unknown function [Lachnospiraceae bacterium RM5]